MMILTKQLKCLRHGRHVLAHCLGRCSVVVPGIQSVAMDDPIRSGRLPPGQLDAGELGGENFHVAGSGRS